VKFTKEEFEVIGDPSERLVQEAIYAVAWDADEVSTNDVVAKLVEWESLTEVEARQRVIDAIAAEEVGVSVANDLTAELWLDPVTEARIERRYTYHVEHGRGSDVFRAHIENEQWIARCALRSWVHDTEGELPNWHELLAAITEHLGLEEQNLGPAHIALNALDAGAIYMTSHPTRTEVVRFDVTDDHGPEGLES
jgi:hypothetical protein